MTRMNTTYRKEPLNQAIYFDQLAGFAYSRRCSILRRQFINGIITREIWDTKRIALDHAYNKRISLIKKEQKFLSFIMGE